MIEMKINGEIPPEAISICGMFLFKTNKSARSKTNVQEKKTDLCYHTVYVI